MGAVALPRYWMWTESEGKGATERKDLGSRVTSWSVENPPTPQQQARLRAADSRVRETLTGAMLPVSSAHTLRDTP